jgi:hypothetical protein
VCRVEGRRTVEGRWPRGGGLRQGGGRAAECVGALGGGRAAVCVGPRPSGVGRAACDVGRAEGGVWVWGTGGSGGMGGCG